MLVVVTRGAVRAGADTGADPGGVGLAGAAVQGLVRSAQAEHPGRFVLADVDDSAASGRVLVAAVGCGEPEVVVRDGGVFARRLGRVPADPGLVAGGGPWRVAVGGGSLGDVGVVADPSSGEPLGAGQVRVVVRAAGLNFRDVLIGLGMYPGPAIAGAEGAGVVAETGPEVEGLVPGDRVLGLMAGLGSVAVADARTLVKVPAGWSFTPGGVGAGGVRHGLLRAGGPGGPAGGGVGADPCRHRRGGDGRDPGGPASGRGGVRHRE